MYFLKPIGCKDSAYPEIPYADPFVCFSGGRPKIGVGNILILWHVTTQRLMSVVMVDSEVDYNPDPKYPWRVTYADLTPSFNAQWWTKNIKIQHLYGDFKGDPGFNIGALQRPLTKCSVSDGYGSLCHSVIKAVSQ